MVLKGSICLVFIVLIELPCTLTVSGQVIRYLEDTSSQNYGQVIVENLAEDQIQWIGGQDPGLWSDLFKVYVGNKPDAGQQAVLGKYTFDGSVLRFHPRFPFEYHLNYYALYTHKDTTQFSFSPGLTPESKTLIVNAIFPSAPVVPANILRFYIYFSSPMRTDNPYSYLSFIDQQGDTVKNVIYPVEPALWSTDLKRLTVLLDPGRIKRGLPSHDRWGLALIPGEKYTLVIGKELTNRQGTGMAVAFTHPLTMAEADHESPLLASWNLELPVAGSNNPLKINFDEPLDQAQCQRWIIVNRENPVNREVLEVSGTLALTDGEKTANFAPAVPWEKGSYLIRVYNNLEDRSGNSLRKPFELNIDSSHLIDSAKWESINFSIK